MERHILRERTSSHIFFREPGGTNACTPWQAKTPLISCVSLAQLWISALCPNLTTWFSSRGLLLVTHLLYLTALMCCHIPVYSSWKLVKAYGVTRNKPKIHVITLSFASNAALVANTEGTFQHITSYFTEAAQFFGQLVNLKKTDVLDQPVPREGYHPFCITTGEIELKAAHQFTYLGCIIKSNAKLNKEVVNNLEKQAVLLAECTSACDATYTRRSPQRSVCTKP